MFMRTVLLSVVISTISIGLSSEHPSNQENADGEDGKKVEEGTAAGETHKDEFFSGEPMRMRSFKELNAFLRRHATEKVLSIIEFYNDHEQRMFTHKDKSGKPDFFEVQQAKLKELEYPHFYAIEIDIMDLKSEEKIVEENHLNHATMEVTIGDRYCFWVFHLSQSSYLKDIKDFLNNIPRATENSDSQCHFELKYDVIELKETTNGVLKVNSFRELGKFREWSSGGHYRVLEIRHGEKNVTKKKKETWTGFLANFLNLFPWGAAGGDHKPSKKFLSTVDHVKSDFGEYFVAAEIDMDTFQEKSSLEKAGVSTSMVLVYDAEMSTWWRIPEPTAEKVKRFTLEVMHNGICEDECEKKWNDEHKSDGQLSFELEFKGH